MLTTRKNVGSLVRFTTMAELRVCMQCRQEIAPKGVPLSTIEVDADGSPFEVMEINFDPGQGDSCGKCSSDNPAYVVQLKREAVKRVTAKREKPNQ